MTTSVFDSDALFRLLVTQVEDYAIFALDTEGRVRTWNPGAERFKGYTPDEILGQDFSVFYPPEARAAGLPERLLRLATETGHAVDEGWRVRKNGERFWASVVITALRDEQGRHVGFAKITRDLTAQRAAEEQTKKLAIEEAARATSQAFVEELEATNEQLQATLADAEDARDAVQNAERFARGILESIADPFVVLDADWRYRFANAPAARMIEPSRGLDPGGVIGQSIWELYPDTVDSEIERNMRRAVRQQVPVSFETFAPRTGAWSLLHCYPLPDGGLAIQWRDITAHKRTEEANRYLANASDILNRSLEYEETLRELAQLVVPELADWCAVDILGERGMLERVAVAHVDPERVRFAQRLHERYPPDPNASTGIYAVLRTGQPEIYREITDEMLGSVEGDQEYRDLLRELAVRSALTVPLKAGETSHGTLSLVSAESGRRYDDRDLALATELAHRAAISVQNAKLHRAARNAQRLAEEANRAKSEFLATMSHELRTPLNAIGGYVDLLRLGIKGPVNPGQDDYLARIERSERYLLSLIQDVLSFAKIEAGRVDLRPSVIGVRALVEEVATLVTPQMADAGLTLEMLECPSDLTLYADPERVRQILLNLLTNAIKFTDRGGCVSVSCAQADGHATITVRDTGIGIPSDRLESIFDPFVQLDREGKGGKGGAGLGLAISRDLARAMRGDIVAESVVHQGSTFIITLPQSR